MAKQPSPYHTALQALSRNLAALEDQAGKLRIAIETLTMLENATGESWANAALIKVVPAAAQPSPPRPIGGKDTARLADSDTQVRAAAEVLKEAGKPMHVMDIIDQVIVRGVAGGDRRKLRSALGRTIDRNASKNRIFKRVKPATFALIDPDSISMSNGNRNLFAGVGRER